MTDVDSVILLSFENEKAMTTVYFHALGATLARAGCPIKNSVLITDGWVMDYAEIQPTLSPPRRRHLQRRVFGKEAEGALPRRRDPLSVVEDGQGVKDDPMVREKLSRAREQELHGLRLELKQQISSTRPGTPQHRALVQQLEALDLDNDAAHDQWFMDLKREYPLRKS